MKQQLIPHVREIVTGIAAAALAASLLPSTALAQHAHDGMAKAAPGPEAMQAMPRLQEKRVITVTGSEDWDALRGFGKDSGMVAMMTLMMVGGSGMEHMKMAPMKPGSLSMAGMNMGDRALAGAGATTQSQKLSLAVTVTPNPPIVGDNTLDIAVTDASGKPVTGLRLTMSVAMTSMDMGTEHPKVTEGKNGHYTTVVSFSMKGPWRVTLTGSASSADKPGAVRAALDFNVGSNQKWGQPAGPTMTLNTPPDSLKVGKNTLQFTILDAAGKPVTGANVTTVVAMTSMDMGTAHPAAREGRDGHYSTAVQLSMKGPWRVTLTVTPPNQKPFTKSFDLNAKE